MQLYQALKRIERSDDIAPEPVSDASHEVAEFTDQATRDALRRRIRRSLR